MSNIDGRALPGSQSRRRLIHLSYLCNLAWQPAFNPQSGWIGWAVAVGIGLAFVPLYFVAWGRSRRAAGWALIATVALGIAGTSVNVGASVLFVYAGVMAAAQGRQVTRWLLGLTGVIAALAVVSFVPFPYRTIGVLSAFFLWMVVFQEREEQQQRDTADRLRIDNVRIEQLATAAERERIARDLHDLLGQSLTSLVVRAQLVQSLVAVDPSAAVVEAGHLEVGARDALKQVRHAVGGLSEVDLGVELDTAVTSLRTGGLDVAVDWQPGEGPNPLVERSLALALREGSTNILRHAEAQHCGLSLRRTGAGWRLDISDDGVGGTTAEGNGLRGMRERITAIGGQVERLNGSGTHLVVTVPDVQTAR